jgi:hypothetical protein
VNDWKPKPLSVTECRRLIGPQCPLSDEELRRVREELYQLATILVQSYIGCRSAAVGSLPKDYRIDVEERAAILEFDGKLPRACADALALRETLASRSRIN